MKSAFDSASFLSYPKPDKPFILTCDASDEAVAFVLGQKNEEGREYVVTYGGKSLHRAEKVTSHQKNDKKRKRTVVAESPYYSITNGILVHLYQRRCSKLPKELRCFTQIALPFILPQEALVAYHDSLIEGGHLDRVYSSLS